MMRVPGRGLTEREYIAMLAASEAEGARMSPLRMQPKVLDKVGHPNEPDRPSAKQRPAKIDFAKKAISNPERSCLPLEEQEKTEVSIREKIKQEKTALVKQRRARINFFKKAISDLRRSGLPLEAQEQAEITIREKIKREKTALLDEINPDLGEVYKLGSKFYIKREFVTEGGQKTHQYFQCEKSGALRVSSLPYFFRGSAAEASDFLRCNPGRYLVRDVDRQKYLLSYSDLDGRQVSLFINKYNCRVWGSGKSNTIDEELASLHRKGIFGYRKNLKNANPPVFYRGTKDKAEDFLWRYPRRYIIRDLGNNRCLISYTNWDGSRVEINARKSTDRARGAADGVTVDQAVRRLHQEGIRGYFKGLEGVPAPVFYRGTKEEADDLLWRYPRTYIIRDLGEEGITIAYSTLDGHRIDIPFKKGGEDAQGARQERAIAQKIKALQQAGIVGYSKEVDKTPSPVFFRGTKEEADDVLWRYPGKYLVRDLDADNYQISYSTLDGGRVDALVRKKRGNANGAEPQKTMSERIAELHQKGIVGFNKESEKSSASVFYPRTPREADDFLWRHPGRYLIRDLGLGYMICYSTLDGRRGDFWVKKKRDSASGGGEGATVVAALAKLHRNGIRGYHQGLEKIVPSPVFYSGTQEEAEDFLRRYPRRYLVRDLGKKGFLISYSKLDGSRVDVAVEKDSDGTANSVTIGETLQKLHKQGIRGYYRGLEKEPPPVPNRRDVRASERMGNDGPPPQAPPPF
jgi:hypothetical protein